VDRCLVAAYEGGTAAEIRITGPVDDTGGPPDGTTPVGLLLAYINVNSAPAAMTARRLAARCT